MRRWILGSWLALSAACMAPDDGVGPPDVITAQSAIKGGEADPATTAVLAVASSMGSLCSGTLIAPNVVLTARHCVSTSSGGGTVVCGSTSFGPVWPAQSFFVSSAAVTNPGNLGEFLVEEVIPLSGALAVPAHIEDDSQFCGNDVAALVLRDNVPPEVAVPIDPRLTELTPGELFSAVGYGITDGMQEDSGERRRRDDIEVLCLADACMDIGLGEGAVTLEEWVGDGGVCSGDSGGPALDAEGKVVGVASRGDADCAISLYAGIPAYGDWLKNVVVLASGMGDYPPPDWTAGATVDRAWGFPVGHTCSSGEACPSGLCVPTGSSGYCSRTCSDLAPCPDGFTCGEHDGAPACVLPSSSPSDARPPRRPDDGCAVSAAGVSAAGPQRHEAGWLVALLALVAATRRRAPRAVRARS